MRIGITYNLKSEVYNIHPEHLLVDDAFEEFDTEQTIDAIAGVLEKNGHSVARLGWGPEAIRHLLAKDLDFVFNISEGYWGRNREAQVPAVLEMLEIPYSGSDPLTLSLALDKTMVKRTLCHSGIKTPDYCVVKTLQDIETADSGLRYPLFVKPAWEGSSKGIQYNSKVYNSEDLAACAEYLMKNYPEQPIMVEEYISGREFTVGVLGNEKPYVLGVMQISPAVSRGKIYPERSEGQICPRARDGEDFFYSREVKRDWRNRVSYECPPNISASLKRDLERVALEAFRAFGCRDIARVDLRVNKAGEVYFLEINPLPGLSPEYADMVIMARKMGWTYERFITAIFNHALSRYRAGKVTADEKI